MTLHVSELWVYPVKSLRGRPLGTIAVEPWGFVHDRRWMVVDDANRALTQRTIPKMASIAASVEPGRLRLSAMEVADLLVPIGLAAPQIVEVTVWGSRVPAVDCGDAAAVWLTARCGQACRLVHMDDPRSRPVDPAFAQEGDHVGFADGFPVLIASTASLATLNAQLAEPVGMSRFRPNLVIEGCLPWAEDGWSRVRIGQVSFRVAKPCTRCIVVTVDQVSGARPSKTEPLRTLHALHRDAEERPIFGQNLIPDSVGIIRLGDVVEVS